MTIQKNLIERIFPTKVKIENESVLVIPNWQDRKLFSNMIDYVKKSKEYSQINEKKFVVPSISECLRSKDPRNAGT